MEEIAKPSSAPTPLFELSQEQTVLTKCISKFTEECPELKFDQKVSMTLNNGSKKEYSYMSLAYIFKTIKGALTKSGLGIVQFISGEELITRIFAAGTNEYIQSVVSLGITNADDTQKKGAKITYWKRYCLCAALGIAGDEDTDAINTVEEKKVPAKKTETKAEIKKSVPKFVPSEAQQFELETLMIAKGLTQEAMSKTGAYITSEEKFKEAITKLEAMKNA